MILAEIGPGQVIYTPFLLVKAPALGSFNKEKSQVANAGRCLVRRHEFSTQIELKVQRYGIQYIELVEMAMHSRSWCL